MTVPALLTAELLIASLLLCLYLHTLQRSQCVKLLQAWLNYVRGKQRRQLRPNTPQDCPVCAVPGTSVNPVGADWRIRT